VEAELVADLLDVILGRARADEELFRDLPVGQALSDEGRNFLFAPGQRPGGTSDACTRFDACRTGLVRKRLREGPPGGIVSLNSEHVRAAKAGMLG